jgi:hypothetical protein
MNVLLGLVLIMMLAWLMATVTATLAIYKCTSGKEMIQFMLRDTYVMFLVGVLLWILMPQHAGTLIMLLTFRAAILCNTNWQLIHDKFDNIKYD